MTGSSQHEVVTAFTSQPAELPEAVVVVGGSAGCNGPLRDFVSGLPADLPAAVLIVVHRSERTPSYLAEILTRSGRCRPARPRTVSRSGADISMSHRPGNIC